MKSLSANSAERIVRAVTSRAIYRMAAFAVLLFACSFYAFGQEATIVGTVTDPSGSVVPNAAISITNTDTNITTKAQSNGAGEYAVPSLHIGHYKLQAEASGFKKVEKTNVVLNVGDRERVDFTMPVGTVDQTVTVEADAIHVQSDSSEISNLLTGKEVTQLIANGRSFYELAALAPGASSMEAAFQVPTSMGGDQSVSFNGQRVSHNLYTIDGGESADRGGSGSIVMPSIDAIAEFRQMTSNYSAQYGGGSAGQVSMVFKSGTKQFHAEAWEFNRNDALDARDFFHPRQNASGSLNKVPELRFNLFGFNVGGPVEFKHSDNPKTFFFYNMEWRRYVAGGGLSVGVPLPSTYGGNMTDALNFNSGSLLLNKANGIYVPCTTGGNGLSTAEVANFQAHGVSNFSTCDPVTGKLTTAVPFAGNQIPTALLNPNAVALLAAGVFPAPSTGNTFIGGPNAPTNVREETVRVDHKFNDKFSIFGHWMSENDLVTDVPTRWSGDNLPTASDTFGNPSYSGVVHLTHTISPTLLNEVAFNMDGNKINMLPAGISALSDVPAFSTNRFFTGPNTILPNVSGVSGSNFSNNWNPWINSANDYAIEDSVSWSKGAHQIKMGGGWANFRKAQPLQDSPQGNFSFNGNFTGYSFSDYLLGLSNNYSESPLKDTRHWNSVTWNAYFQDDWRATSRLTLNLGLRWEGLPHTAEVNGQMSNFYPNLYNPANAPIFANANDTQICSGAGIPNASCTAASPSLATGPNPALNGLLYYTNGLGVPGTTPGVTNGLVDNHWDNFGPRVGFAYDLFGNGKTIVRAGAGIVYERIQGNDMYQMKTNLFGGTVAVNNVSLTDPHVGIDSTNTSFSPSTLPVTVNQISELDGAHYKIPTDYQFSGGVQQQLGSQTVLSVSYVGAQDRYQSFVSNANIPAFSALNAGLNNNNLNGILPFLGYSQILNAQDGANSHYNSLQATVHSNLRMGLQLQASYTLSKAFDPSNYAQDGGDLDTISNPWVGWQFDNGPSNLDRRHIALVNFIYDLPIFKNSANHFVKSTLGGWQVSGTVTMESGTPLNITDSGTTICGNAGNLACQNRPDLVSGISYPAAKATLSSGNNTVQWFNQGSFAQNLIAGAGTPATFGDLGKNAVYGPGMDNWNMALFKNFVINAERGTRFEFRAESFNTWNHTEFTGVNTGLPINLAGSDFGKVNSSAPGRVFQLGAKFFF